ncbi:unnamed protein product [Parnassius mnemosyne]|uniref:Uncharacterized protein n=1 Tax=Parnassius mnemosyne TaxID=213953 RepID=A0AAV1KZN7_9NEOP
MLKIKKCSTCKTGTASPNLPSEKTVQERVPSHGDLENIRLELSKITKQISSLPQLIASVQTIQADLSDLKVMKSEMMDVKNSLNHVHTSVEGLTKKLTEIDREIQSLQKTKDDVVRVENRLENLEAAVRDNQQRSRLNNIETKGVPVTSSENLFTIISIIGSKIGYEVPKEQINYVARVPQRNNKNSKNIIVSLHTRYLRDNFIAAAKKCKSLTAADLGFSSDGSLTEGIYRRAGSSVVLTELLARFRRDAWSVQLVSIPRTMSPGCSSDSSVICANVSCYKIAIKHLYLP